MQNRTLIHWRSLVLFGLIFWFLLCLFDFMRSPSSFVHDEDFDRIYHELLLYEESLKNSNSDRQLMYLGLIILLWISITLLYSTLFCWATRRFWWTLNQSVNGRRITTTVTLWSGYHRHISARSKIPIKIQASTTCIDFRSHSQESLQLLPIPKFRCSIDVNNNEINKLKEEFIKSKDVSSKALNVISKKLVNLERQNNFLKVQLETTRSDKNIALQEIRDLIAEKEDLMKTVEEISVIIKSNVKSKKRDMGAYDELIKNCDNLERQFQECSKEKKALEKKLQRLQEEYKDLKENLSRNYKSDSKIEEEHFEKFCLSDEEATPSEKRVCCRNKAMANLETEIDEYSSDGSVDTNRILCVSKSKHFQIFLKKYNMG
ncbi:unnamed protein product [Phyllotreta striolata]|uniref:Uncharacterized protein n=1 Tax=Phyllotreta striolata TaxID=444603 RepID=A0A9P0DQA1_PHYSR|nr:unnamed protein product [Phyllotreta striolata]